MHALEQVLDTHEAQHEFAFGCFIITAEIESRAEVAAVAFEYEQARAVGLRVSTALISASTSEADSALWLWRPVERQPRNVAGSMTAQ